MTDQDSTTDPEIREIRERRDAAENEWAENIREAKKDRLCVAGKTWEALDPKGLEDRENKKRPHLNLDELNQYINQQINSIRANPRGIKFAPTGNGANDATAEFYEGYIRECEYRSHAPMVYSHAFDCAVTGGMGWVRVLYKRLNPRSLNSDLCIEMVANPDQVLPDPSIVWSDARDMQFLFYVEPWSREEFTRRFKDAKVTDFSGLMAVAPTWVQEKQVQVAEYWTLETRKRVLMEFTEPKSGQILSLFEDEITPELQQSLQAAKATENFQSEEVDDPFARMRLTNGLEVLHREDWPGRYIPFASCMGKVLYVDESGTGSKRLVMSMIRHPRVAQMERNYVATCKIEAMGAVPRSNWIGWKGTFSNPEEWTKANTQPVAFLEVEATMPDGRETPTLPQRQPWDPPIQNLLMAEDAAKRSIQAAFGITPMPTNYPTHDQRLSGKAMDQLEASGQKGSYHFVDSFDLMVERVGIIAEDLLPHVLETPRDVPVRKPNDTTEMIRVNDPNAEEPVWTDTDHRVTISHGPASESQRAEGAEFVEAMVSNIDSIAQLMGPPRALKLLAKSIKLKQLGPIGDEIIDLCDPPQLGQDGKPLPPEVAQLMGENQQLKQIVQQAAMEKQAKLVEQQGKMQIVQVQEQHEDQRAALDRERDLAVAELKATVTRMELFIQERERIGARMEATLERVHAALESTKDRVHERLESERDRSHERDVAQLQHEAAMQQAQQAADLAPPEANA